MCTVLLRFAPGSPYPLVFGAVRDEFVDRAWDPPAAHWGGHALGTPAAVTVWSWDGAALSVRDLTPGDHLIVNEGVDPDRPVTAKLHATDGHDDWQRLLGDDAVLVDREYQGRRYGSTSTSLV